jgi:arginine deiminase
MTLQIAPSAAPALSADSDVGVLERVMVHRPGAELARVTAGAAEDLLFDGPVALRDAQREHDALVAALHAAGVRVEQFERLLGELLLAPGTRRRVIDALCEPGGEACAWLGSLPASRLAHVLVTGVAQDEATTGGSARVRRLQAPERWLVRPLPNLMYARDVLAVVGPGVVQGCLARPARRGEAVLTSTLLAEHPRLQAAHAWVASDQPVEGGDVLPLGGGVVVVGVSERTSLGGARALARRLLDAGVAREVIAAILPPGGPFHLDLALTQVDRATLLADAAVVAATETERWRAGVAPERGTDLLGAIGTALGGAPRVVETLPADHGRAWDRGANVVAVRPGAVIAYADNGPTNRRLERAGIEVIEVPGESLGRGRGGPHCLTAPLSRAPL